MGTEADPGSRVRAYRRPAIGASVATGVAVGLAVASLALWTGSIWPLLLLAVPFSIRAVGAVTHRMPFQVRWAPWLWPIVALVVAVALTLVLPESAASLGLGVAVGLWFVTLIATGILEVFVDPGGRLGL